jgi:PAS domain-containing protein
VLAGAAGTFAVLRSATGRRAVAQRDAPPPAASEQDRAERLVEALPFAAFTVDRRGRVRVFNAAAGELFGVERRRAPGRALMEAGEDEQ